MKETDDQLRARLEYVAGPSHELARSTGKALDDIAWRYGLRRRDVPADDDRTTPVFGHPALPLWGTKGWR